MFDCGHALSSGVGAETFYRLRAAVVKPNTMQDMLDNDYNSKQLPAEDMVSPFMLLMNVPPHK